MKSLWMKQIAKKVDPGEQSTKKKTEKKRNKENSCQVRHLH